MITWFYTTRNFVIFNGKNHWKKCYKLSKKVFSTVKMTVETITQTYVENFFSTTYVTVEKCVYLYQWLLNVKLLLKTVETYAHKYWEYSMLISYIHMHSIVDKSCLEINFNIL